MKLNQVFNAIATLAVACTVIPHMPGWAVTLVAAIGATAAKLAQTPIDKPGKAE